MESEDVVPKQDIHMEGEEEEEANTPDTPHNSSMDAATHSFTESSPAQDRNPEPPAELVDGQLLDVDNIGTSVFSKRWLLKTLMKLLKTVEPSSDDTQKKQGEEEVTELIELDDDVQNELCKLWDMSMNGEVVQFLLDYKAVDILTEVVAKSKAPRAMEICLGILGNMACNVDVCLQMVNNENFVELVLMLLENPDPQTLVETTRLLIVSLSHKGATRDTWLTALTRDLYTCKQLIFILQSSTNGVLLQNAGELADTVLDLCPYSSTQDWYTPILVAAVLEAASQASLAGSSEAMESFLHILQLMSTCDAGVQALVEHGQDLLMVTLTILQHVCEDTVVSLDGHENTLASALSVINVLLPSYPDSTKLVYQDYSLTRCVLKILDAVFPKHRPHIAQRLQHHRQRGGVGGHRRRTTSDAGASPTHNAFTAETEAANTPIGRVTGNHGSVFGTPLTRSVFGTPLIGGSVLTGTPVHGSGGESGWRTPFTRDSVAQASTASGGAEGDSDARRHGMLVAAVYDVLQGCLMEIVLLLAKATPTNSSSSTKLLNGTIDNCHSTDLNSHTGNQAAKDSDRTTQDTIANSIDTDVMNKDSESTEEEDGVVTKSSVPLTLEYLNSMCLRTRLQYMVCVLKECNSSTEDDDLDLLQTFQDCILRYNLERLRCIVRST